MKHSQFITLTALIFSSTVTHADTQWGLAYTLDMLSYEDSDTLGSIHESLAISARQPANEFISVGLTLRAPGSKKQVKSTLLSLSSREELHAVTTYHSQYHWGITLDSRITAPDLASSPVQPYIKAGAKAPLNNSALLCASAAGIQN